MKIFPKKVRPAKEQAPLEIHIEIDNRTVNEADPVGAIRNIRREFPTAKITATIKV